MSWIDWTIMAAPMAVVCYIAWVTQRYVRGVSDFLAAGRVAGRYLVCTASGMAGMGVISVVAACERNYHAGFAISWWGMLGIPVGLIMTLTGFVSYRYRETRAMTMPELLQMRYSRRFRVFAGILAAGSGILNYGIFPAVAGRFFVYFCGLPDHTPVPFTHLAVPTFALTMLVFLGAALVFVMMGGQLTIMVTDCVQGLFSYAMYLVVALALLYVVSWHHIAHTLLSAPPNQSYVNPFRTSEVKDFNIYFALIGMFTGVYIAGAWQGTAGFNASAASAHEQKMGGILGNWRGLVFEVMQTLLAICALTYMTDHAFAGGAAAVNASLSHIGSSRIADGATLQEQMRVPVALAHFLPVGVKGIFAALMFFLACTNDVSYLHSWGSIVAQDVILPFRKTPLSPTAHIRLIKACITGITVFAFCWSLLFPQKDYIYMYLAVTGAIFLGGAGSVIIGGLYWSRGTTAGAWTAMVVGSSTAVGGIVLDQEWFRLAPALARGLPSHAAYLHAHADKFPINGQYVNAMSMAAAILSYVAVSLATCRQPFDLPRMLHRGKWNVDTAGNPAPLPEPPPRTWRAIIGIDEHFTAGDKRLSVTLFVYSMIWFGVFAVVSGWNLTRMYFGRGPAPDTWWVNYWFYTGIVWPIVLGTVTSVWFTIGGVSDLRKLFGALRAAVANPADDGEADVPEGRPAIPSVPPAALVEL